MFGVMSNMKLHLDVADCFRKAALRAKLDSADEHTIETEAGQFWRELSRAQLIKDIVAVVEEECAEGRLQCNQAEIWKLVQPYPKYKRQDEVLANHGDYWGKCDAENDEKVYVEDGEPECEPCESDACED